jgi:hypothetical protein
MKTALKNRESQRAIPSKAIKAQYINPSEIQSKPMENPLKSQEGILLTLQVSQLLQMLGGQVPLLPSVRRTAHGGDDLRLGSGKNSKHVLVGGFNHLEKYESQWEG